jgi:2-amino-4-hydroxy-6-hydroxymethyldihydropteridine diphosphokinase
MNGIEVGLSLGSNLDDRLANLQAARAAIAALPEVALFASAPIYETEPIGVPPEYAQQYFYNTILILGTSLDAHKLFAHLQKIELALGRKRTLRQNTPRVIDIDLIYYNGQTIRSGGLVVPHPRWTKRRFVLQPLADVRDYLVIPGHDRRVRDILAALPPGQTIKKVRTEW